MKTWNPIRQHISGSIGSRDWDLWEFSEGLCYLLGMEKSWNMLDLQSLDPHALPKLGSRAAKGHTFSGSYWEKIRQTAGPTNPKVNACRRCFWDSGRFEKQLIMSFNQGSSGGENGSTFRSSPNEVAPISQIEVLPKLIFPRPKTWIIAAHG